MKFKFRQSELRLPKIPVMHMQGHLILILSRGKANNIISRKNTGLENLPDRGNTSSCESITDSTQLDESLANNEL
jgi:hypothetical protein